MSSTRDILTKARELVARPGGWCQREYEKDDGSVCSVGAIYVATRALIHAPASYEAEYQARREASAAAVRTLSDAIGDHVPSWNDHPLRKQPEVVAAFDATIAGCA